MKQEQAREEQRKEVQRAEAGKRIQARLYPDRDEDWLRKQGTIPDALQACLAASARLRPAHAAATDQAESR